MSDGHSMSNGNSFANGNSHATTGMEPWFFRMLAGICRLPGEGRL